MYVCLFSPYYNRGHCNAPGFFRLQERTQIKFLFLLVRKLVFLQFACMVNVLSFNVYSTPASFKICNTCESVAWRRIEPL